MNSKGRDIKTDTTNSHAYETTQNTKHDESLGINTAYQSTQQSHVMQREDLRQLKLRSNGDKFVPNALKSRQGSEYNYSPTASRSPSNDPAYKQIYGYNPPKKLPRGLPRLGSKKTLVSNQSKSRNPTSHGLPDFQSQDTSAVVTDDLNSQRSKSQIKSYKRHLPNNSDSYSVNQLPGLSTNINHFTPQMKKAKVADIVTSRTQSGVKTQNPANYHVRLEPSDVAMLNDDSIDEGIRQQMIYKILRDQLKKARKTSNYQYEEKLNRQVNKLLGVDKRQSMDQLPMVKSKKIPKINLPSLKKQNTGQFQDHEDDMSSSKNGTTPITFGERHSDIKNNIRAPTTMDGHVPHHYHPQNLSNYPSNSSLGISHGGKGSIGLKQQYRSQPPGRKLRKIDQVENQRHIEKLAKPVMRHLRINSKASLNSHKHSPVHSQSRSLSPKLKWIVNNLTSTRRLNPYCPYCRAVKEMEDNGVVFEDRAAIIKRMHPGGSGAQSINSPRFNSFLKKGENKLAHKRQLDRDPHELPEQLRKIVDQATSDRNRSLSSDRPLYSKSKGHQGHAHPHRHHHHHQTPNPVNDDSISMNQHHFNHQDPFNGSHNQTMYSNDGGSRNRDNSIDSQGTLNPFQTVEKDGVSHRDSKSNNSHNDQSKSHSHRDAIKSHSPSEKPSNITIEQNEADASIDTPSRSAGTNIVLTPNTGSRRGNGDTRYSNQMGKTGTTIGERSNNASANNPMSKSLATGDQSYHPSQEMGNTNRSFVSGNEARSISGNQVVDPSLANSRSTLGNKTGGKPPTLKGSDSDPNSNNFRSPSNAKSPSKVSSPSNVTPKNASSRSINQNQESQGNISRNSLLDKSKSSLQEIPENAQATFDEKGRKTGPKLKSALDGGTSPLDARKNSTITDYNRSIGRSPVNHSPTLTNNSSQKRISKISKEVENRLLGKDKDSSTSKLCSTIHKGTRDRSKPASEDRSLERSRSPTKSDNVTIDLKKMPTEKASLHDAINSPIHFEEDSKSADYDNQSAANDDNQSDKVSQSDKVNQVSSQAFSRHQTVTERFEMEVQTSADLLPMREPPESPPKEERNIEVQTGQTMANFYKNENEDEVACQTDPVEFADPNQIRRGDSNSQQSRPKTPPKFDWANSELFQHIRRDSIRQHNLQFGNNSNNKNDGKGNSNSQGQNRGSNRYGGDNASNKGEADDKSQENAQDPNSDDVINSAHQDELDLNPLGEKIYTEIEATYKQGLLKKKARSHNTPEMLQEMHDISKTTIAVLTRNMIMGDVTLDRIFEFYQDVTRENVIKMLLRCRKMYEARTDVKKILRLVVIKEERYNNDVYAVLESEKRSLPRDEEQILRDALAHISRIQREINSYRQEHKIFKGKFTFRGKDCSQHLLEEAKEIIDFLASKGRSAPILKENGLIVDAADDDQNIRINNYDGPASNSMSAKLNFSPSKLKDQMSNLSMTQKELEAPPLVPKVGKGKDIKLANTYKPKPVQTMDSIPEEIKELGATANSNSSKPQQAIAKQTSDASNGRPSVVKDLNEVDPKDMEELRAKQKQTETALNASEPYDDKRLNSRQDGDSNAIVTQSSQNPTMADVQPGRPLTQMSNLNGQGPFITSNSGENFQQPSGQPKGVTGGRKDIGTLFGNIDARSQQSARTEKTANIGENTSRIALQDGIITELDHTKSGYLGTVESERTNVAYTEKIIDETKGF